MRSGICLSSPSGPSGLASATFARGKKNWHSGKNGCVKAGRKTSCVTIGRCRNESDISCAALPPVLKTPEGKESGSLPGTALTERKKSIPHRTVSVQAASVVEIRTYRMGQAGSAAGIRSNGSDTDVTAHMDEDIPLRVGMSISRT